MPTVNNLVVEQAGTVLASLVHQATGQAVIAPTTPGDFTSVATVALRVGKEPILNAMSQMWGKTIFSVRPYDRKFRGMEMDLGRWGNAVRKLNVVERDVEDDDRFTYPVKYDATENPADGTGLSVDMYALKKPDVLQTNFYGQSVYQNHYTIFRDNLDTAFTGPDEFMRFNQMIMQNKADKLEQYRETIARGLLANYIGALLEEAKNDRVIHLLTEYNTETGLSLTAQDVYKPGNFGPFIKWTYARIAQLVALMGERSQMFQTVINGKPILRHTPADKVKCYLAAKSAAQINAMVLADTFNDNLLKLVDFEGVNFWQSIETPDSISVKPTYTDSTGAVVTAATEVEQAGILGVLFDEDALGYAQVNAWNALTPFNARGGYWNDFDHVNFKTLMDMSEKGIVLLLD